jgi:5-methylcytosine-specific restriction endonuclease McrA
MQIPQKLGHNFTFSELLNLELLHTKYATHRRLRVFHNHGTKCVAPNCDKEGIYLIKAKNTDGGFHVDLYTKDFELMTIDHIHPKSKGGDNSLANLQPMCQTCNSKKGAHIP